MTYNSRNTSKQSHKSSLYAALVSSLVFTPFNKDAVLIFYLNHKLLSLLPSEKYYLRLINTVVFSA